MPTNTVHRVLTKCHLAWPGPSRSEEVACPICLEQLFSQKSAELPLMLPCGHIFGDICLLMWVKPLDRGSAHNNCPLCRAPILPTPSQDKVPAVSLVNSPERLLSNLRDILGEVFFIWLLMALIIFLIVGVIIVATIIVVVMYQIALFVCTLPVGLELEG